MEIEGNLLKMSSFYSDPISYELSLGEEKILVNELLGKTIRLEYLHEIHCIRCGRKTSRSFAQGYCFPCFQTAPETEECVLRPELCQAHAGIARDLEFARKHCLIDHYVYIAYTSGIKVGVTRHTQIPTRWIDQGAVHAVKLAKTPNRYTAGCIEVAMKDHYNDKTNWRKMLNFDDDSGIDIMAIREEAARQMPEEYKKYLVNDSSIISFHYPHIATPGKLNSISLDKQATIRDILVAIKGQYLIFEGGSVLNIRKHNGYRVKILY